MKAWPKARLLKLECRNKIRAGAWEKVTRIWRPVKRGQSCVRKTPREQTDWLQLGQELRKWMDIVLFPVSHEQTKKEIREQILGNWVPQSCRVTGEQRGISFQCTSRKVFWAEVETIMFVNYGPHSKRSTVGQCSVWDLSLWKPLGLHILNTGCFFQF